ncbi:hypothetical protein SUGI_0737340 [Cryptomeria japonica]|nr:hypothetical protein SUGI_0737340 [Cryptomeria japonica]
METQASPILSDSNDTTIIIGAGISGIMAAKTLSEKGVTDFIILEATNRIGGRMHKESVGGYTIEMGANWVEGVGSSENVNPIWTLANKYKLRTFKSNWDNISNNIYDQEGHILPQRVVAKPYEQAVALSDACEELSSTMKENGEKDISILVSQRICGYIPTTRLEMAIDFFLYDFETGEPPRTTSLMNVEPIATFKDFGIDNYFVADSRGYEHIVHRLAQEFLSSHHGNIIDKRLKLKKVVCKIEYSDSGVKVSTEDGSVYTAKNTIVSVSAGVLQSKLIGFKPDLPMWKLLAIYKWNMVDYCKIFMKFPSKFWPTGPKTEYFLYAHKRRGYYNFWQHLESEHPGGNLLVVTVLDEEARRIEQQPKEETKAEIMEILRKMFGNDIPEMTDILIPKWGQDRFYKGTFSNWPIGVSEQDFDNLQAPVGPVFFTGEHTSQKYNGYVHGAYYAGIHTAKMVSHYIKYGNCTNLKKTDILATIDTRGPPEIKREKISGCRARRKAPVSLKRSV